MSANTSPMRVGVLGLGRSGYGIHVKALRQLVQTYRIVAVHDPLSERRDAVASELNATAYDTESAMLADSGVELVVVASPNLYHADQAERALLAGKHVLCEKPFGLTVDDVDRMVAASRRSGCVLQPFQQRRYEPDFCKLQEVIASGKLGDIQLIRICWHGFKRRWDWQTMRECAGGALNNNGPHPLDHAMILFGEGEPEVWAEAGRHLCSGDAEDHLRVVLRGAGRPTVEVELSDIVAYGQDRWLVCGTAGALRGTAGHLEWKYADWQAMPDRPVQRASTRDRSYNSESLDWTEESWEADGGADGGAGTAPAEQPVFDLYAGLHRSIREGAPQEITPESVRRRVALMERIRECAQLPAFTEPELQGVS